MTESAAGDDTPPDQSNAPAASHRWRNWLIGLGTLVAILVVAGIYLGYTAFQARGELESAREHASEARSAVLSGDVETATAAAAQAGSEAHSAEDHTHNPVWSVAAAIPWLGEPLESARQMTDVVSDLADEVLVPTADLAEVLNPNALRVNDTINIAALAAAQDELAPIAESAETIAVRAGDIDGSWLRTVTDAQELLAEQTTDTARFVRGTATAAQLLPPMLGADGERNYFLGFQTPSESRATGGLLGAYGIVNARDGVVKINDFGSNAQLGVAKPSLDFGDEFNQMYGINQPYRDSRNSNLSPHFPYAAQIWMSMWENQSGQKLDGAIAVDPIALSYLLAATGPVRLTDGEVITAENVVPITLSTSYERFGGENPARKAYLQEIARRTAEALSTAQGDTRQVLEALGRGVHERRIMIYSADPSEQKLLESTNLGHEIPETTAPYMNVVVQNMAGNKIDYYLKRDISYTAGPCTGDTRTSVLKVALTNTVTDTDLPDYVGGSLGNANDVPPGTNIGVVQVDGTAGAMLDSITQDGSGPLYATATERGHPLVRTQVLVPPGKTVVVEMTFTEPTTAYGPAQVPVQPLVDDPTIHVDVPECSP